MKAGAVESLTKSFRDLDLLDAIHLAPERNGADANKRLCLRALRERFESLSTREREVVVMGVSGMSSRCLAHIFLA